MDEYLKDIGNDNRSKYIEKLITEDLIKRGKEIKKNFNMQTNEEKTYQIRFNTNSTTDVDRWRLVCDSEEQLVSNIVIDSQTYTTKDYIEGVGDKWHVSCTGVLDVKDGIAHITVKRKDNALRRHLYKTISYRILGTITTVTVAYSLGMSLQISSLLGVGELVLKPILYFLHERFWYRFGKTGG